MSEAPKTVWVTKDALSRGILQFEANNVSDDRRVVVWEPYGEEGGFKLHAFDRSDWHPTREAALARANEMKAAKIASLKRQIERLEALEF